MKLEFFTGVGTLAFGLVFDSFGACVVGLFFVLLVVVEVVPTWLRRELHLWRAVTHHDFDQPGLARVDDRRAA
jgi:hypothetical protein